MNVEHDYFGSNIILYGWYCILCYLKFCDGNGPNLCRVKKTTIKIDKKILIVKNHKKDYKTKILLSNGLWDEKKIICEYSLKTQTF